MVGHCTIDHRLHVPVVRFKPRLQFGILAVVDFMVIHLKERPVCGIPEGGPVHEPLRLKRRELLPRDGVRAIEHCCDKHGNAQNAEQGVLPELHPHPIASPQVETHHINVPTMTVNGNRNCKSRIPNDAVPESSGSQGAVFSADCGPISRAVVFAPSQCIARSDRCSAPLVRLDSVDRQNIAHTKAC